MKRYSDIIVLTKKGLGKNGDLQKEGSLESRGFKEENPLASKIYGKVQGHPPVFGIVKDPKKIDFFLVIGNLTTSPRNSIPIVKANDFHKKQVFIYNEVRIEKIDENNIEKVQQLAKYKDSGYTEKISLNPGSNKIDKIIETKATEKMGKVQVTYLVGSTFEEKTKKLADFFTKYEEINNKKD